MSVANMKKITDRPGYEPLYMVDGTALKQDGPHESLWTDTNLATDNYSTHMTPFQTFQELIQNIIDEIRRVNGGTLKGIQMVTDEEGNVYFVKNNYLYGKIYRRDYSDGRSTFIFENYAPVVKGFRNTLRIGGTTKAHNSRAVGTHGEGLKSVIAYCLRNNVGIDIKLLGKDAIGYHLEGTGIFNPDGSEKKKKADNPVYWCTINGKFMMESNVIFMKFEATKFTKKNDFFRVTLDYTDATKRFKDLTDYLIDWDNMVFFAHRYGENVIETGDRQAIILDPEFSQRIYHKNMYLVNNDSLRWGYNVITTYKNRDRNDFPQHVIRRAIVPVLNHAIVTSEQFAANYLRLISDEANKYIIEYQVCTQLSPDARTRLYQLFRSLDGHENVQMLVPPGVKTHHLGNSFKQVSIDLYNAFTRGIDGYPPYTSVEERARSIIQNQEFNAVMDLQQRFSPACELRVSRENIYLDYIAHNGIVLLNSQYYERIMQHDTPVFDLLPVINELGVRLTKEDYIRILLDRDEEEDDEESSSFSSEEEYDGVRRPRDPEEDDDEEQEPREKRRRTMIDGRPYEEREITLKGFFLLQ